MSSVTAAMRPSRKPAAPRRKNRSVGEAAPPRLIGPKPKFIINTEASDRFRALPPAERRRRLEAFREACAPAFESVDDYLAWKHGGKCQ